MALTDELSWIIPIIMTAITPIVVVWIIRRTKMTDSTANKATMATFNIGSMKDEVKELKDSQNEVKEHFDKKIDLLTISLEKRDEKNRSDATKVWERLEQMYSDIKLHDYRLGRLDTAVKRNGNNQK